MKFETAGYRETPKMVDAGGADFKSLSGPLHFVGIGGIGMSALAKILLLQGVSVSGSDRQVSPMIDELKRLGAQVFVGHQSSNVDRAALVVVSTAIQSGNPEVTAARERSIPVWHRSQVLSQLARGKKLIAISGTHGKTTTTAMISQILLESNLSPSIVIGGFFPRIESNAEWGSGDLFVAEADESDGTHSQSNPYISLVTNIEADHLENYPGGVGQIQDNMLSFVNHSSKAAIICLDDAGCRKILPAIDVPVSTFGLRSRSPDADYTYESAAGKVMRMFKGSKALGEVSLSIPGEHNKSNALGASVIALTLGVGFEEISRGLSAFTGVDRRFQLLGKAGGVTVVDDYAHHPTEVIATLQAARQYLAENQEIKRVVAVFQPHQPGRLKDLWQEFCQAFVAADVLLLADVYVARGNAIEGINSERLCQEVNHSDAHYLGSPVSELPRRIVAYLEPGDLLLTIGAGDITRVGGEVLALLKQGHMHGPAC